MREKGHEDHEIHDKINEFHETSPEEVKRTAQGILKRGCESVFQRLFGEYIADEIIQAREQGASTAELDEKINTALGHIKNAKKRREATRFAATCRRIFTMIERRRRAATPIEEQTLEELFSSHLSWLTEAQQEELRRIRDEGFGRTEMQERVVEWLGELSGHERANAMEQLREGCTLLLFQVYGKDKANDLIKLKNQGAPKHEIALRLVDEEQKQSKAFGPVCRHFFIEGNY
ncbi:unnamed protein product [Meloidogyne enterolobii]|uniref:Uncharacterized protein n=1 Tax=Meloidogyne enterolobii TaxID=390850 RepID=A0ACB0ZJ61_MELEN